jgi:hypothetical protein
MSVERVERAFESGSERRQSALAPPEKREADRRRKARQRAREKVL